MTASRIRKRIEKLAAKIGLSGSRQHTFEELLPADVAARQARPSGFGQRRLPLSARVGIFI
jgi:hypothetical protein